MLPPSDQSVIVIAWERPAVAGSRLATTPRKLLSAVKAAGGLLETKAPGGGKARSQWVGERLADLPVRLTPRLSRSCSPPSVRTLASWSAMLLP
ncbi:MAG: hypothetical protein IPH81_20860 [Candidatus Microthrix sp.]|nr:hypothetical protein [Candidatus Microthrix sp.]